MHLAEHGDDLACVGASLQGQDDVSHVSSTASSSSSSNALAGASLREATLSCTLASTRRPARATRVGCSALAYGSNKGSSSSVLLRNLMLCIARVVTHLTNRSNAAAADESSALNHARDAAQMSLQRETMQCDKQGRGGTCRQQPQDTRQEGGGVA